MNYKFTFTYTLFIETTTTSKFNTNFTSIYVYYVTTDDITPATYVDIMYTYIKYAPKCVKRFWLTERNFYKILLISRIMHYNTKL